AKPVLVGCLAGMAVTMIVSQLGKLTGVPVGGDTFVGHLASFVRNVSQIHPGTLLFAGLVLAFLLLGQWRFPAAPVPLLAVLLATPPGLPFDPPPHRLRVVGPVPPGPPVPALPDPPPLSHP